MSPTRTRPPWWTEADQAEFDVVTFEIVYGLPRHVALCPACHERRYCRHASAALGFAVLWRERRELLSKAEYLRRREEGRAA
jgi:hypothetical protein